MNIIVIGELYFNAVVTTCTIVIQCNTLNLNILLYDTKYLKII